MKFARYLRKELIFLNLDCTSKEKTLMFLTEALCNYYKLPYKDEILCDAFRREEVKSTGLGNGLAIPHCRTDLVDNLYVLFARSDEGIEWASNDDKPVHYIFYIVSPTRLEKEYLEVLGDISRVMSRYDVREAIKIAKKPGEVIQIIKKSGVRRKKRG